MSASRTPSGSAHAIVRFLEEAFVTHENFSCRTGLSLQDCGKSRLAGSCGWNTFPDDVV
eukprot:m.644273 g.644273  ORF g.644273 m.644273 type:complete len:59 (-) comp22647_c0_seq15:980-1156(-)